jgi:hypothetical protein
MENSLECWPAWAELETEHRHWLSAFDPQYLRSWGKVRNGDYEAALCEAAVRRLLQGHGVTVLPNEDLAGKAPAGAEQRPDYRCSRHEGPFFVEVACIPISKVVEQTGLPHPSRPGTGNFGYLNDAVFMKCWDKNSQCSETNLPTLLAVGIFHLQASVLSMGRRCAEMLLTGEPYISWNVNTETGQAVGDAFQTTKLHSAAFLRPQSRSIQEARTSLSGLLLCGFGCDPLFDKPHVVGVLHPFAARPFDTALLPDIPFGEVRVNPATGRLFTSWPDDSKRENTPDIDDFLS